MRRFTWMFALALVAVATFACSQDGGSSYTSTPVSADTASFTSVAGAARSNSVPVLLCHFNEDWETELTLAYEVIEVDDNSAPKHCANHGDFNSEATYGCTTCDLSAYAVGDDCSACAAAVAPSAITAAAKAAPALICHNDVDDDHPYDSIAIVVNGNSVDSHFANHGDCPTADAEGTENCSCLV